MVQGIRGATTVSDDSVDAVREAVTELLDAIVRENGFRPDQLASAIFTLTPDLREAGPAAVARAYGWSDVPLLQVLEHGGGTQVARCIRVLVLWNTDRAQSQVRHVYLRGTSRLRGHPDTRERG